MGLKFKYRDLWYHGKLVSKRVYEQLEDLQKQIDELKTAQQTNQDSSKESEPQEGGS
jgi:hypothetical protein